MPHTIEHKVTTAIPGPKSQAISNELNSVFDARAIHFVVDYDKSSGN